MNFSYLSQVPVSAGQPMTGPSRPPPCTSAQFCASETIHFATSATGAFVRYTEARNTVAIAPSYTVGGGVDAASQALVPIVSQPRIDVAVEHKVTRRDVVVTEGGATAADSTPRVRSDDGRAAPIGVPNPPLCAPHENGWACVRSGGIA